MPVSRSDSGGDPQPASGGEDTAPTKRLMCPDCGLFCKGQRGFKQHRSRSHSDGAEDEGKPTCNYCFRLKDECNLTCPAYAKIVSPPAVGLPPLNCGQCGAEAIRYHPCPECGFDPGAA